MWKEFKEFAVKGNVLDLAVGVMIGAAFGAITNSLVADIITPLIGLVTGGRDFKDIFFLLKEGTKAPGPYATLKAAQDAGAVTMNVGVLMNLVMNFLIVAFALFMVVKAANKLRRPEPEPAAPEPTAEEKLLAEIRDLLKQRA